MKSVIPTLEQVDANIKQQEEAWVEWATRDREARLRARERQARPITQSLEGALDDLERQLSSITRVLGVVIAIAVFAVAGLVAVWPLRKAPQHSNEGPHLRLDLKLNSMPAPVLKMTQSRVYPCT